MLDHIFRTFCPYYEYSYFTRRVVWCITSVHHSHHEKTLIYIVIYSYELHTLVQLIKQVDQQAFIVTRPVKNVFGNFKRKTIA